MLKGADLCAVVKIKWKHVWLGATVTGVLFTIGKTALAFYFGTAQAASAYGSCSWFCNFNSVMGILFIYDYVFGCRVYCYVR